MSEKRVGAGFGVMLLKEGKVLLGKRHDDPEKASSALRGEGTWTMPGGKFEYGESFLDGTKRELMEETGMTLKSMKVVCVNNVRNEHAHFVTLGFFSEDFSGEPAVMEPDEITEWGWFSLDDLPQPIFPPSMQLIECYREGIFCKYL